MDANVLGTSKSNEQQLFSNFLAAQNWEELPLQILFAIFFKGLSPAS